MKKYSQFITGFIFGAFIIYMVSLAFLSHEFGRMADLYRDNCGEVIRGER